MKKANKIMLLTMIFFLTKVNVYGVDSGFAEHPYNKILFIVDISNSMNFNDREKLTNEIIKMFVDGASSKNTEVGFITYNDRIVNRYEISGVGEVTERNNIKREVNSIRRFGNTDVGLALRYGVEKIEEKIEEGERGLIILFSDGETDLRNTNTGRTEKDSLEDEKIAIEKAKELKVPIYSVGLTSGGALGMEYLQHISESTGGKAYEIQNSRELVDLFNTLFGDSTKSEITSMGILEGTGAEQTIEVEIAHNFVEEANIIIQHNNKIRDVRVDSNASDIQVYSSDKYTAIKLTNPLTSSASITFTASENDNVKVNLINVINVKPSIEIVDDLSKGNIEMVVRLYDINSGNQIVDSDLYKGLVSELLITNIETGEISNTMFKNTGNEFKLTYKNNEQGMYKLEAIVSGENYKSGTMPITVEFSNSIPEKIEEEKINVLRKMRGTELDLNNYYKDGDGDILKFELISNDEKISKASVTENILTIESVSTGLDVISIRVSDGRGGEIYSKLEIEVMPFVVYYKKPILWIGSIFSILLVGYVIFIRKTRGTHYKEEVYESVIYEPVTYEEVGTEVKQKAITKPIVQERVKLKNKFKGARFEGYFLSTKSGNEVPILNWNASYINNKSRVLLGELLFMLDVKEYLPEAYKITFDAGSNNKVIFHHQTSCIVTVGNKNVPKGKKIVLNYEDKLYIVFNDHETEIEIRYKRARKTNTV